MENSSAKNSIPDCILIGYNDLSLSNILSRLEPYKNITAAFEHVKAQSIFLKGQRLKYGELLNACLNHSRGTNDYYNVFRMPSLGLNYLANFLFNRGISTCQINFFNHEKEELKNILINSPPYAVAISTTYYYEPEPIIEIVKFIRSCNPNVPIIVGGTYINNIHFETPESQLNWTFKKIDADIYVHDLQGELTLSRVCKELRSASPQLQHISNLIYREEGQFKRTKRETENNNLDENPITHITVKDDYKTPAVFSRTSRSCPNQCSFCRYPLFGGAHTLADLSTVEKELDYYHSLNIKYIVFVDDTLNIPLERFKSFCRLLIHKQYHFKWFSYFRCSDVDDEVFDLMAEAGCTGVFLGIESGDPTILINMNKNATVQQYEYGIKQLHSRGIMTLASFMIGFPGETQETARNTIQFIEKTQPTFYSLQVYFHEIKVPIAFRKDEFGLKGYGYGWSHNTMTWQDASKIVYDGYQTIKNSTILPLYSCNIWSLAYYMSLGITKQQLLDFTKIASSMLINGMQENTDSEQYHQYEQKILSVFKG